MTSKKKYTGGCKYLLIYFYYSIGLTIENLLVRKICINSGCQQSVHIKRDLSKIQRKKKCVYQILSVFMPVYAR